MCCLNPAGLMDWQNQIFVFNHCHDSQPIMWCFFYLIRYLNITASCHPGILDRCTSAVPQWGVVPLWCFPDSGHQCDTCTQAKPATHCSPLLHQTQTGMQASRGLLLDPHVHLDQWGPWLLTQTWCFLPQSAIFHHVQWVERPPLEWFLEQMDASRSAVPSILPGCLWDFADIWSCTIVYNPNKTVAPLCQETRDCCSHHCRLLDPVDCWDFKLMISPSEP